MRIHNYNHYELTEIFWQNDNWRLRSENWQKKTDNWELKMRTEKRTVQRQGG